jgi:glyoxylate reductase
MEKVLVTREIPGNYLDNYKSYDIIHCPPNENPENWLYDNIEQADGILITLNEKIGKELIDRAKKLKVISTFSVGFDHIDVEYAKSKNIVVTNTPEVLTDATADLIFGIMIAVARNIVSGNMLVKQGLWKSGWNPKFMLGSEIHGKTIGIIGMGRIGQAILKRSQGFGMKTIYYSKHLHNVDAEFVEINQLLKESDFVVVALDLNKETYHYMDYGKISSMKDTAYLINGTRGKVIDQQALIKILEEKKIAGAALDVFEEEPLNEGNPLLTFENVVLTPHIGSATEETRNKMAETAVINLFNVLEGNKPLYQL